MLTTSIYQNIIPLNTNNKAHWQTGLYYYGARYYNPRISNWLSVDPIALWQPIQEIEHYIEGQHNGGYFNPQNMSVYGYTYQSPVNYIDPNGKQVWANGVGNYLESQFRAIGTQIDDKVQHVAFYFSAPFRALNVEFGGGVGVGLGFKSTKYFAGRIDAEVFGAKLGANKDGADLKFSAVKLKGRLTIGDKGGLNLQGGLTGAELNFSDVQNIFKIESPNFDTFTFLTAEGKAQFIELFEATGSAWAVQNKKGEWSFLSGANKLLAKKDIFEKSDIAAEVKLGIKVFVGIDFKEIFKSYDKRNE